MKSNKLVITFSLNFVLVLMISKQYSRTIYAVFLSNVYRPTLSIVFF